MVKPQFHGRAEGYSKRPFAHSRLIASAASRARRTSDGLLGMAGCLVAMLLAVFAFGSTFNAPAAVTQTLAIGSAICLLIAAGTGLYFRARAADLDRQWREAESVKFDFGYRSGTQASAPAESESSDDRRRAECVAKRFRSGDLRPAAGAPVPLGPQEQFFHADSAELARDEQPHDRGTLVLTNQRLVFVGHSTRVEAPLNRLAAVHWVEGEGISFRTAGSPAMRDLRLSFPSEFMAYLLAVLSREGLAVSVREETANVYASSADRPAQQCACRLGPADLGYTRDDE